MTGVRTRVPLLYVLLLFYRFSGKWQVYDSLFCQWLFSVDTITISNTKWF